MKLAELQHVLFVVRVLRVSRDGDARDPETLDLLLEAFTKHAKIRPEAALPILRELAFPEPQED